VYSGLIIEKTKEPSYKPPPQPKRSFPEPTTVTECSTSAPTSANIKLRLVKCGAPFEQMLRREEHNLKMDEIRQRMEQEQDLAPML
jgi:hypothetical protein